MRDRPMAVDGVLAGVLALVSSLALVIQARNEHMPPPGLPAVALVLAVSLPLAWRRRHPFWINLGVGAASAVYGATSFPDLVTPVPLGGVAAMYGLVAWSGRRRAVVVGVVTGVALVVLASLPATRTDVLDFTFTALLLGGAWVLGDSARIRRAYTAELERRASWLARERELEAQRAVTAERARIARELHDVVAHHVSMMVVQAEAGSAVAERDGAGVVRTFDTISGIGRQALVEMRRLLGVLREEAGRTEASLAPQPGVAQLPALVEQVREAGLRASLEVEGEPVPLPPGVDLSVYRIVQEALTNVLKHAGQVAVRVRVRYGDRDVRVEVCDHGAARTGRPGSPAPAGNAGASGNADTAVDAAAGGRPGHGLIGMRERVQLFGGELTAGPGPDGGFTVAVRLPVGGLR
ncbi:histidine kinase [Sphaerisporangium sp. TRM90804]|uniref:sensor histidine kinase n=1 Tax=Sphaerisporangium sp. TRM90804 TaxID=3031113 RepID=UPI00244C6720|nr:histidine kinase [Sphaerisporangium sp. TRM90804]MDH2426511.1 histidine kinase [Sphaerisporangium sp. TRM90804]